MEVYKTDDFRLLNYHIMSFWGADKLEWILKRMTLQEFDYSVSGMIISLYMLHDL